MFGMSFWTDQARRFAGCIASWRRVCKVVDDRRSVRVLWICPLAFLVHHCDRSFFPQAESNGILFDDQVEELMHQRYCFFESSFDSFCLNSPAVRGFSFFETAGCTRQFFSGEFRDVSVLLRVFIQCRRQDGHKCLPVLLRCLVCLLFHRSYLSIDVCRILRIHWQCHFSLLRCFPTCFSHVMRTLFFLVLMLATFRNPLNSSTNSLYFSCFFFFADVSHLGLVFSVHISSYLDEGKELLVFTVDRFFLARCSCSCALLKYFTLFTCDCFRRRRMLLVQ